MSVAERVKEYVEKRPYIQEALARDIVNYAALAREIEGEVDGGFEAVKVALRRHSEELREARRTRRNNVAEILQGTSIELKSNVRVCKSNEREDGEVVAKTENGYTAVQSDEHGCGGDVIDGQVMITLKSPENLEETPGVMAYVLSILAGRDINVTELVSCREDTHIVIDEGRATEAFELLNEKLI
ncbi:MAG: hypothetical protein SVQ76_01800 [Candidatus Nanohaloarchaea archaeon]|nr:hypothetical protein [Candidatus Nanohaloarchaea archaeon]